MIKAITADYPQDPQDVSGPGARRPGRQRRVGVYSFQASEKMDQLVGVDLNVMNFCAVAENLVFIKKDHRGHFLIEDLLDLVQDLVAIFHLDQPSLEFDELVHLLVASS